MRYLSAIALFALTATACTSTPEVVTTTSTTAAPTTTTTAPTTTTTAPTTTTTISTEAYGGTAVIGIASQPGTLNPFLTDDPTTHLIAEMWTVGVQTLDGVSGRYEAHVVDELPTIRNGGVVENGDGSITVTYTIREDAVWADGVPITGDDFQFTLDTILDPSVSIPDGVYGNILSSAVSDKTFSYTLAFPTIEYEQLFDVIIPKHVVDGSDFGSDWNDRTWVSGGPFMLERMIEGQQILMSRNPAYWVQDADGLPLPYLDGVSFEIIEDATARFEAIASGAAHAMRGEDATSDAEQYGTLAGAGATITTVPGSVWVHLNFQFGPARWDRNPDSLNEFLAFRQGVMHAIDRDRIATELFGDRAVPLDSYVGLYHPTLSAELWNRYDYDPAMATELVDQAIAELAAINPEAPSEALVFFTTNASNPARVRASELIGEMLGEVGVAYLDTSEDSITFFGETVGNGRFDMSMWAWQADHGFAPLVSIHDVLDPSDDQALTNFYRWGTPESSVIDPFTRRFQNLLLLMEDEVDHDQLSLMIQEAEMIIAEQAVFLPLYAEPVSVVHRPDVINGFSLAIDTPFTWNAAEWTMGDR